MVDLSYKCNFFVKHGSGGHAANTFQLRPFRNLLGQPSILTKPPLNIGYYPGVSTAASDPWPCAGLTHTGKRIMLVGVMLNLLGNGALVNPNDPGYLNFFVPGSQHL